MKCERQCLDPSTGGQTLRVRMYEGLLRGGVKAGSGKQISRQARIARRLRPMHQSHEEVGDFDSLSTDTGPHVEEKGSPVGHTTSHSLDAVKTGARKAPIALTLCRESHKHAKA